MLIDSHTNDDNKRKRKALISVKFIFDFCRTFEKLTKSLGVELQVRTTPEKQNVVHTTLRGNDVEVTISSLYPYIASVVPSPAQQQLFIESVKKSVFIF